MKNDLFIFIVWIALSFSRMEPFLRPNWKMRNCLWTTDQPLLPPPPLQQLKPILNCKPSHTFEFPAIFSRAFSFVRKVNKPSKNIKNENFRNFIAVIKRLPCNQKTTVSWNIQWWRGWWKPDCSRTASPCNAGALHGTEMKHRHLYLRKKDNLSKYLQHE